MKRGQYNLIAKQDKERPYIIGGFIATKLNKKQCETAINLFGDTLKDYVFIPYKETDFSWWQNVRAKLTLSGNTFRLKKGVYFDIDWYGNVYEI